MLENVHLAPGWLMQLEKKLHSMQPHASFRLFLTMEINPKVLTSGQVTPVPRSLPVRAVVFLPRQVPVNLLRAGRIFVFEPPPGVKANMLRTFSSIPVARMCKVTRAPERHRQSRPRARLTIISPSACRRPTSAPVSTSCWPGSTPSSRSGCVTHRWAGPRSTSLESLTFALPVTPSTRGWTTPPRLVAAENTQTHQYRKIQNHTQDLYLTSNQNVSFLIQS